MKKSFFLFTATLFFAGTIFLSAMEVDKAELESAGSLNSVIFINYSGPHKIIHTVDQIRSIGSALGDVISAHAERETRAGELARYYVIHAVDPSVAEKLDADILILGEQTIVDHIDNLRRIIGAYLESAYGYSRENAQTLAAFISVYNAVYRGKTDVFQQKYKTVVTGNLTADKAGLALNYAEWPGKTQIVIPLSDIRDGKVAAVDTSVISDLKVIESMKKEPDKSINERKSMVTIKETEAENAQVRAQKAQEQATEAKKEADAQKQKLEKVKKEAKIAKQKADANPEDKEAQKKAQTTQKEAVKQTKKTAKAEKEAETLEKEAETQQIIADKKQTEAQKERIEIAKDQQQLIRDNAGLDSVIKAAYGLKITDEKEQLSAMVLVDTKTGRTVKESPVTVIRNRVIYPDGTEYIAVAGKTGANAAVKLVKLDSKNMEIVAQSEEILAADSVLVKDGSFYYVVIQDGKNYVAAKYDGNLKPIAKSNVPVIAATPISVTSDGVMVTDTYGFAKLLKNDDLKGVE